MGGTMPDILAMLLGADDGPSAWRAVAVLVAMFASCVVFVLVKRRVAPRTIRAWSGHGVCEDLTPAQAAVLLRVHPSIVLGVLVGELVASGRARVISSRPLLVDWPRRSPDGSVEEALDRAIGENGEVDPEKALDVLEALHAQLEEVLAPWSGRATAVWYRERVRRVLDRVQATDRLGEEDVLWLLLENQNRVYDAEVSPATRREVRGVVRFGGTMRGHLLPAELLRDRADGAKTGYFAFRRDLLAGRGVRSASPTVTEPRVTGPGATEMTAVAAALEGRLIPGPAALPIGGPNYGPVAVGRMAGRPASALFGEGGELDLEIVGDEVPQFLVESVAEASEVDALRVPTVHVVLDRLAPFTSIRSFGSRVRVRVPYSRKDLRAEDVLARLRALVAFVEALEKVAAP
jgi:hypothetical protein